MLPRWHNQPQSWQRLWKYLLCPCCRNLLKTLPLYSWTWPFQWICLASYLKVYVILEPALWWSTWNLPQQHNRKHWKLISWKKPSKSFAGNAFKLEFWRETSRCGFKHLRTTLLNSHMEDFALLIMIWPGKKFLTSTRFHMTIGIFTFVLIILRALKNEMILSGAWCAIPRLRPSTTCLGFLLVQGVYKA